MKCRRIVCGVTASMRAQRAALDAAILARKTGAELIYVHVVDMTLLKSRLSDPLSISFVEDSLVKLGMQIVEHAAHLAKTEGIVPEKYLVKGPFRKGLQRLTRELGADLLVLGGEHGKPVFREVLKLAGTEEPLPTPDLESETENCRDEAS